MSICTVQHYARVENIRICIGKTVFLGKGYIERKKKRNQKPPKSLLIDPESEGKETQD